MHKKLKRFGGILFFCGTMFFFGCQTEELALEQQNYEQQKIEYRKVSFDQVQVKNSKVLGFFDKALRKAKSSKLGHRGPNPDDSYAIDSTSVVFISYDDYSTYTFSIVPDSGANLLQNIVIADTPEGLYSYLSEYELKATVEEVGQKDISGFINDSFLYELENPYADNNRVTCFLLGHYNQQLLNHCQGENVTPGEMPDCFDANGKPKMDQVFIVSFSVCSENNAGGDGVGNNSPLGPGSDYPGTPTTGNNTGGSGTTAPGTGNPNNGNPVDPNLNPGGANPGTGGGKKPIITGPVHVNTGPRTVAYLYSNISADQSAWLVANQGSAAANYIYTITAAENYGSQSIILTKFIIDYLRQHPNATFEQFQNWFMMPREGKDFDYDASFWENPNLTFEHQNLPSWNDFDTAYPTETSAQIYGVVGGEVAQAQIDFPLETKNGCALKVSRALNYSGVIIPRIITTRGKPGTLQGADGKYYFLNAKALNAWMRETFGTFPENPNHYNFTATDGGTNGENFPTLVAGLKGIFSMISSDENWSSGHADILEDSTCLAGCHFQDTPAAPIESIDIWVLE